MKKKLVFVLLALPLVLMGSSFHSEEVIKSSSSSVVKIFTSSVKANYASPWTMSDQRSSTGSGVLIEGGLILTAAHVVSDATYIEVKKSTDAKKFFASVKWIAHDADLALLEVRDKSFYGDINISTLGEMPKKQDGVAVYGYPVGGHKISITQGVISRFEHSEYAHSNRELLIIQIDAAVNPGNSGGPAFNKAGEIVGIAIQTLSSGDNIGYLVPPPVIRHFLEDIKDGVYHGFPCSGIYAQRMENMDLKNHYKMGERTGILVTHVVKGNSADGYLKTNDIILAIDGLPVADDGTLEVPGFERLNSEYMFTRPLVGETVRVKFLRDAQEHELNIPLKAARSIILNEHEKKPRYYIFGGMIFMPFTINYLLSTSSQISAPTYYSLLLEGINVELSLSKQNEIVFIKGMLADEINAGYSVDNEIVTKVNDVEISSLKDLVKHIDKSGNEVKISTLDGTIYILNKEKALQSKEAILKRYCIQDDAYLGD